MMHLPSARMAPLILAALSVAGCAGGTGPYPSLGPRPIERNLAAATSVDPAATPAPAIPADPAADADVATQLAAAEAARTAFIADEAVARRAVDAASGQPAGGEAWVTAQQALSRLDQARGPIGAALANLDEKLIAAGGAPAPALSDAWTRVSAIEAEQRAAVSALAARLPQP